jgi:predicted RNase H-like HicB family nuclease
VGLPRELERYGSQVARVIPRIATLRPCGVPNCPSATILKNMKFRIVLEYDADTQAFSAVCPELPGCASAGDTEEEAKQNIKEAIELYLAPSDVELSRDARLDEVTVG